EVLRRTVVDADAKLERSGGRVDWMRAEALLDCGGAANGIDGIGEGEKKGVADRHDLFAVVVGDRVADEAEMLALDAFEVGSVTLLHVVAERGCAFGGA